MGHSKGIKSLKNSTFDRCSWIVKSPSIDESLISEIKKEEIHTLFEDGIISGGIIMLDSAQKAKENVHAVVAIGGDGTINEIARSLVHT